MIQRILDRLFPRCEYCGERSAAWGGDRCPLCWKHPDYEYDQ